MRRVDGGMALAITHLIAITLLLAALAGPYGSGEWSGFVPFALLTFLDFPFSLIPLVVPQLELNTTAGLSGYLGRVVIDGIVGTVWYYNLPPLLPKLKWNW